MGKGEMERDVDNQSNITVFREVFREGREVVEI